MALGAHYTFGSFQLLAAERVLLHDGVPVRIGSRAFDLLHVLLRHAGRLLSNDELLTQVWGSTIVDEGSIRVQVAALRKALGHDPSGSRWIVNEPLHGYGILAPVARHVPTGTPVPHRDWNPAARLPPAARLVGREDIIRAIGSSLHAHRLVTLVGAVGVGKSSLAIEVARRIEACFEDGLVYVDLSPIGDPGAVPQALAVAVGAPSMKPDPAESAMTWLRDRRLLLVIDNCEHVLEAVATFVEHVLRRAPHTKVFATSSEALRADGEWVQRVGGLAAPRRGDSTDRAQALRVPAVELLLSKSGIDDGGQHLSDAEVAAAVDICRSVEGIPLAIELAASRVRMLGLQQAVALESDSDGLLGENRCATLPRHQSLRAAMDWSCGLLGDEEVAVLRRLAIFPGPFPLRAAVFVGQCPRIDERLAASCVVSLVNRSLVSLEKSQGHGAPLYRLMATTRAYALQSLVACGEAAAIQCRHAQWCKEASGSSGPAAADRQPA